MIKIFINKKIKVYICIWISININFHIYFNLNSANSDDEVRVPGSALSAPRMVVRAGLQTLCISSKHCNKAVDDCNNTAADDRARLMQLLMPGLMSLVALGLTDDDVVCVCVCAHTHTHTHTIHTCTHTLHTHTHTYT